MTSTQSKPVTLVTTPNLLQMMESLGRPTSGHRYLVALKAAPQSEAEDGNYGLLRQATRPEVGLMGDAPQAPFDGTFSVFINAIKRPGSPPENKWTIEAFLPKPNGNGKGTTLRIRCEFDKDTLAQRGNIEVIL